MEKTTEVVQRIKSHYVGDDCVQIMIPYVDSVTVLSQDGVLLHDRPETDFHVNKYLEDERRKQFPYSNIPTHCSIVKPFGKFIYSNQLFDFEKPYIKIRNRFLIEESFAVKDHGQALLVNKTMQGDMRTEYMTYEELLRFIEKRDSDDQIYYVLADGSIVLGADNLFPTEEGIYRHIREQFEKEIKGFREQQHSDMASQYFAQSPSFLSYLEETMKNLDFSFMDFNIAIGYEQPLFVIRTSKNGITIQEVKVKFIRKDVFEVTIYDVPVSKYTLEQLKAIPKILTALEPKIPLKLNPDLTKEDIKAAKQMIKSPKKQSW